MKKNELVKIYIQESKRIEHSKKRILSYYQEGKLLARYIDFSTSRICDVGCGGGEFLSCINWTGPKFGMEINPKMIAKAKKKGIRFTKNIINTKNFFDVVIFRGSIQHLPFPFLYIDYARKALKPGGFLIFLQTPNSDSIFYRIFGTLPMLTPRINYYIPSESSLSNVLVNFNFKIIKIEKRYYSSPYSSPALDFIKFLLNFFYRDKIPHAFIGNTMDIVSQKNFKKTIK